MMVTVRAKLVVGYWELVPMKSRADNSSEQDIATVSKESEEPAAKRKRNLYQYDSQSPTDLESTQSDSQSPTDLESSQSQKIGNVRTKCLYVHKMPIRKSSSGRPINIIQ